MNKLLQMGIIKTAPRKWTKEEEKALLQMRGEGLSPREIARKSDRSEVSVSIKLKRLTKTGDTYNIKHRQDKYEYNSKFLDIIKPVSVLDVYAGNSFYKGKALVVLTNDVDEKFDTDTHFDSFKLLCKMNLESRQFDLVDLDPYGSAVSVFDLAIRIARNGIVVTLGEMGHKRWKRLDFVRKWYDIESFEDFTTETLIKKLQKIAICHKKQIEPIFIKDYNRISRVWFRITEIKTYEQWQ